MTWSCAALWKSGRRVHRREWRRPGGAAKEAAAEEKNVAEICETNPILVASERWMGLGSVALFTLEEARQKTRKARQQLAEGIDPLMVRRAEQVKQAALDARNKTFAVVCSEFYDAHSDAWVSKHRANFLSSLQTYAYPIIGSLTIAAIDEPLVLQVT